MRPRIPEELTGEVQAVYEGAGYGTATEFVRDAVRRRVDEIQAGDS